VKGSKTMTGIKDAACVFLASGGQVPRTVASGLRQYPV